MDERDVVYPPKFNKKIDWPLYFFFVRLCAYPLMSLFEPSFVRMLADPAVKTVMVCGCGGGFDFVHGQTLYPELKRLGKKVVLASFTFGRVDRFEDAKPYWSYSRCKDESTCVLINGSTKLKKEAEGHYAPDLLVCQFLDIKFPDEAPHSMYTMYARDFSLRALHELYSKICKEHSVDAVVIVDGGTDSIMAGDERGLGDPIEDAVSVGAVSELKNLRWKLLINMGFGCDRFNHVSDASSLRAVAELTRMGGFRGCISLEQTMPCFQYYKELLDYIYKHQSFHSVIASSIVASGQGWFGCDTVPPSLSSRMGPKQLYLWPLMAQLWAFDIDTVVKRSFLIQAIKKPESFPDMMAAAIPFIRGDAKAKRKVVTSPETKEADVIPKTFAKRKVENLPRQDEFSVSYT